MNRCLRYGLLFLAAIIPACSPATPVEKLSSAELILRQAQRRIGESLSLKQQAGLQGRGDRVLKVLTAGERYALGRNLIRFHLDSATVVNVAAPQGHEPFWLTDQGFTRRSETIETSKGTFTLHRKTFPEGWVGLGVNSLDQRTPAHYVAFVDASRGHPPTRFLPESAGPALPLLLHGWPQDQSPVSPLPDDLMTSVVISNDDSTRHASAFLSSRPWKTHVPSKNTPDQVVVSFGGDSSTTLAWNWRTRPEVEKSAVRLVELSRSTEVESWMIAGDSSTIESYGLLNDLVIRRHRAKVDGLKPDTLYAYAVGDGSSDGWSAWKSVRTGPKPGQKLQFLYMGDAQCGLEGWGLLLNGAMKRHPEVRAILLAGDLVDRGNERSNWDHFFLRANDVFDRVPFMPAVGNHEYLDRGPLHYSASFTLPDNGPPGITPGLVYATELGDAHLLVLDSNLAKYDPALAKLQASWVDEQFRRSGATWRIVMFHHPIYASHPTRENPELARAWVEVFDRNSVDLVLQGHDHAYLRTHPMRGGHVVNPSDEHATTYVVSVSGDKYVDQAPRDYAVKGFTGISTYQLIEIDPASGRLIYRSFDGEGVERDQFELRKHARPTVVGRPARIAR